MKILVQGAKAGSSRSEPELALGPWPSGAAQKRGGSATLPMLPYRFHISFKNSKFIFQNQKLNLYLPAVLQSCIFFGRLRMAKVLEPTPNVKKNLKNNKSNKRKPKKHQKNTKKNTKKTPKKHQKTTKKHSKKALTHYDRVV